MLRCSVDFDIQIDEHGRLKLPVSLRDALTSSSEMSLHVSLEGKILVLHRSTKAPAPATALAAKERARTARITPPSKPQ